MEELNLSKYNIRTDLAIEAREIAIEHKGVDHESKCFPNRRCHHKRKRD